MVEVTQEIVTTKREALIPTVETAVLSKATNYQKVEYVVYFILGVMEILLAFRLVLKAAGASLTSGFVSLVYALSGLLIFPFEGIFRRVFAQGIETTSVFEPSTIVAMIVFPILAWGIIKLIRLFSGEQQLTD